MLSLNRKIWLVVLIIFLSLSVALAMAEFSLKELEKSQRQKSLDYGNTMRTAGLGQGGYLQENLTLYVTDGLGSTVRWTNNAAGFRNDEEFNQEPPPGALRILSLGDSFNAGYRVGQHETFPFLREQWLKQHLGTSQVFVSEVEEPATALYYLNKFGLTFHPHIVMLGITLGNDIVQSYIAIDPKGAYSLKVLNDKVNIDENKASIGVSTFGKYDIPSSYLQPKNYYETKIDAIKNWFSNLHLMHRLYQDSLGIVSWYPHSDVPKLFDICNGLGVFLKPPPPMIEEAYQRLFKIVLAFQTVCRQQGIIFVVQLFPQRFQVQPPDWDLTVARYRLNKSGFDLMEPNRKIAKFCSEHKIILIDPTEAMAQRYAVTGEAMYFPRGDMHWNREGHRAFFDCSQPAFSGLVQVGFKLVKSTNPATLSPTKVSSPDHYSKRMRSGALH